MKVYIVTAGSYSDYRIASVWLDEKLAEEAKDLENRKSYCNDAEVDEREIGEVVEKRLGWMIYFNLKGEVQEECFVYNILSPKEVGEVIAVKSYTGNPGSVCVKVNAEDEATAKKIAQDRLAQFMAEQAGI